MRGSAVPVGAIGAIKRGEIHLLDRPDAVISESGVARMTLYRHFTSKEELVLAYLERREEQWTR